MTQKLKAASIVSNKSKTKVPPMAIGDVTNVNEKFIEHINALNMLWTYLNEMFFDSALSKNTVVTIQRVRATSRVTGWFVPYDIWACDNARATEINMSANFLYRTPLEKAATFLHEMCHQYAHENNIKDTCRQGRYHNKRFKEIAEKHGLIVEKSENGRGFSVTKFSPTTISKIENVLLEMPLLKMTIPQREKKQSSTRKLVCHSCYQTCRVTSERFSIKCGFCDVEMKKANQMQTKLQRLLLWNEKSEDLQTLDRIK